MATMDLVLVDDSMELGDRMCELVGDLPVRYDVPSRNADLGVFHIRLAGDPLDLMAVAVRGHYAADYVDALMSPWSQASIFALLFGGRDGVKRAEAAIRRKPGEALTFVE